MKSSKVSSSSISWSSVFSFLLGYRVLLSLGSFPIKEYIYKLNNFYIEEQRFEIEIIDGIDF